MMKSESKNGSGRRSGTHFRKKWRIHQESKMEVSKVLFRCVWSPGVLQYCSTALEYRQHPK
jgi:hypothetical protein